MKKPTMMKKGGKAGGKMTDCKMMMRGGGKTKKTWARGGKG